MIPIKEFPESMKGRIRYLLTDIDDTLTTNGRIPGCAFTAMETLRASGIKVVPITGRPAGWCDHIARMWPVDGVVGENGAFYFHYDTVTKKMMRKYFRTDAQRKQDRVKLKNIGQKILEKVPGCRISADQAFREADLAIDFCEDVPTLPESEVLRIVEIFKANGAVAKISSIHVNGWFGNYDKLSMTRVFFNDIFHLDIESIKNSIIFSGDSPNDEPMFEFFPNSVGVANIRVFKDTLSHPPVWITGRDGGHGFAEMAEYLM